MIPFTIFCAAVIMLALTWNYWSNWRLFGSLNDVFWAAVQGSYDWVEPRIGRVAVIIIVVVLWIAVVTAP